MPLTVTDHAVLRWLERVEKVDVHAIRERIATIVGRAPDIGAPYVTHDGYSIILDGPLVLTVLAQGQKPKVGRNGKSRWRQKDVAR